MLMAASAGLIMLFLGLEIMSIALYVMAAYHRRRAQSGEAGLKYFILGSFSSAIFLYGVGPGLRGDRLDAVRRDGRLPGPQHPRQQRCPARRHGPAHRRPRRSRWRPCRSTSGRPDVYQGAPTPFTGYMAAVAKAAGFAGLFRVLSRPSAPSRPTGGPAIWVIAVLTLLVGSVLAIVQRDLKRMLAYSSISQAGYVLVGVQAGIGHRDRRRPVLPVHLHLHHHRHLRRRGR